ncbi:hypothetical protein ACFQ3K_16705, partial [Brucella gallinifaecis]|uniref:hypothetical protein n=1 Tax=Brucella gallinifaecis TaxID=215590 RepID=UPI00363E29DB
QDDTFGKLRPFEIDHYPAPLIINQTYQTSTKSVKLKNFATEPLQEPDIVTFIMIQALKNALIICFNAHLAPKTVSNFSGCALTKGGNCSD